MTYGELHRMAAQQLGSAFEAAQLFTHVTSKRVMHLSFLKNKPVPDRDAELLRSLCGRRLRGEPLQYLLGEWEFYGLPLKVGSGVLIPRQDTETLVDTALACLKNIPSPRVLDLCSGTGCVAIAISHERPDADVTALEVSGAAYDYLIQNIRLNSSPVHPVLESLHEYRHTKPLDMVVSNPPYIPRQAIASLQTEVQHEPRRALDGGMDGLDFYRAIVRLYYPQLTPDGQICMEVGIGQSGKVCSILAENGYRDIGAANDLGGIARVVYARRGAGIYSEGRRS